MKLLHSVVEGLRRGSVDVIDLTQPLHEGTPVMQLPEPLVDTPGWRLHEISRFDERGPDTYWNWFVGGEHVGTHLDAPAHWISGKDGEDVSQIPPQRLVGPAVVIDKSAEAAADPDYLLRVADVLAFADEYGPLPEGGWLLYRTGWDAWIDDRERYLNIDEAGPHTPGVDSECAQWLAEETPIVGLGVETVGTDAGAAHLFTPPFPCHYFFLGAGKYGVTQLTNLDRLPSTGAVVIVAPLKILRGSGSPVRVFALVERP